MTPQNSESDKVTASVLVPILNEEGFLPDTLPAMLDQDFGEPIEFLLLDGGSTDRTLEVLAEFAAGDDRIRVLDNPGRIQSKALNIGLAAARGEFIVRMDAHTYYPREYLRTGVNRLRRGDVAWVGGPQLPLGTGGWSSRIAAAMETRLGVGGASFRFVPRTEFVTDAAFTGVLSRELLHELGGWDEDWLVNEDGELAARVRESGGVIVCVPEMAAKCVTRDSLTGLGRQYFKYGYDRAKTAHRHPGSLRRSHLIPPALGLATLAAAITPRPLRRVARLALAAYAVALGWSGSRAVTDHGLRIGGPVPLVLAVMHYSWAIGFFQGWRREYGRRGTGDGSRDGGRDSTPG